MPPAKKTSNFYRITYRDPRDGMIVILKARVIKDSTLGLSFISISDFFFETDAVVVNPVEEQQRKRFEDVKSLHLSIYTVISIEEIGPQLGGLSFKKNKSNLVALPIHPNPQK